MTREEVYDAVLAIASRASLELGISGITVAMDLTYCMEHQSLDLEQLYSFPAFDFALDVCGIHTNLNHETHELEKCFLPRCAN